MGKCVGGGHVGCTCAPWGDITVVLGGAQGRTAGRQWSQGTSRRLIPLNGSRCGAGDGRSLQEGLRWLFLGGEDWTSQFAIVPQESLSNAMLIIMVIRGGGNVARGKDDSHGWGCRYLDGDECVGGC